MSLRTPAVDLMPFSSQDPASEALFFRDAKEWRAWLSANHDRSSGVWVFIYKKGSLAKGLRYEEAVEEALCFGWIDSQARRVDDDRFVQWYSPRKRNSIWSEANKARALRLLAEGRMTDAGVAAIEAARRNGRWGDLR